MKPREDFSLIKVILWDIDGTLLNFKMSERYAIDYCFNKFHMGTCTDEMLQRYSVINRGYWERLETGELTREQVMLGRFHEFFESEGLPTDQVKVFNDEYQIRLGDKAFFCDHGDELVKQLKATVKQYAVTNGTTALLHRSVNSAFPGLISFWTAFLSRNRSVWTSRRRLFLMRYGTKSEVMHRMRL